MEKACFEKTLFICLYCNIQCYNVLVLYSHKRHLSELSLRTMDSNSTEVNLEDQ